MELMILEETDVKELLRQCDLHPEHVKVTYRVVCLTPSAALIEMVPDAVEFRDAKTRPMGHSRYAPHGPRSLREFFEEREDCKDDGKWDKVLAFMLHLSDRHNQNVMVAANGRYFHIDFGYVLGRRPLMHVDTNPPVRIDYKDIWDATSAKTVMEVFWKAVHASYRALRRHSHVVWSIVCDLEERLRATRPSSAQQDPAAHVTERLLPGVVNEEQADLFIEAVLLQYRDDLGLAMHDKLRQGMDSVSQSLTQRASRLFEDFTCSKPGCKSMLFYDSRCVRCPKCAMTFCRDHADNHDCRPAS